MKTTVPSTYYSLVYNAWGYGGLQMNQTTATRRAIIPLWNQNKAKGQQEASTIYAFNGSGRPPANYSITVTGASGALSHSTNVVLTVE